jgi:hypothetical protein
VSDAAIAAVSWGPGRSTSSGWTGITRSSTRPPGTASGTAPESLGGTLASPPAATAWAGRRAPGLRHLPDGQLWNRYWDRAAWHDWESLGGELTGTPAARPGAPIGSTSGHRATARRGTAGGRRARGRLGAASALAIADPGGIAPGSANGDPDSGRRPVCVPEEGSGSRRPGVQYVTPARYHR